MSAPIFTPSRAHQTMYFVLSGVALFGGLVVCAYYMVWRDRAFADVIAILQAAVLFGGLFWLVGMMIARRRRKVISAIYARANMIDGIAAKLVNHV